MKFKKRPGDLIHEKIDQELFIDIEDINQELIDQPLLFRKYAQLEAEAAKTVRTLEVALDRAKARAHVKMLKDSVKMKVKDSESMVLLDEEVSRIQDELIEAQELHDNMRNLLIALRQRHDALKDLSANIRKEITD